MRRAILASAMFPAVTAATHPVFIGNGGGNAKRIFRMGFDPETGRLGPTASSVEMPCPDGVPFLQAAG